MWQTYMEKLQKGNILIHNITNYVTVNDCANILLACGASPIMADAKEEVEEITAICDGLHLNIGTINMKSVESMLLAGKKANQLQHPILLDPVGVGASTLRTKTAIKLITELQPSVIRGNISEIKTLALGTNSTQGVDAAIEDTVNKSNVTEVVQFMKAFSKKTGAVIVITGAIDLIVNEYKAYAVYNGHPMMSRVTGTGCMLSALITAYISANPKAMLEAATTAVLAMGISGEIAYQRLEGYDGNASYRNYIIDAMYHMNQEIIEKGANYEIL